MLLTAVSTADRMIKNLQLCFRLGKQWCCCNDAFVLRVYWTKCTVFNIIFCRIVQLFFSNIREVIKRKWCSLRCKLHKWNLGVLLMAYLFSRCFLLFLWSYLNNLTRYWRERLFHSPISTTSSDTHELWTVVLKCWEHFRLYRRQKRVHISSINRAPGKEE